MKKVKTKKPRRPAAGKKAAKKGIPGTVALLDIVKRLKDRGEAHVRLSRQDRANLLLARSERLGREWPPDPDTWTVTESITFVQFVRDTTAKGDFKGRDDGLEDLFTPDGAFFMIAKIAYDSVYDNHELAMRRREIDKIYGIKADEDWPEMDDEKREDVRALRISYTDLEDQLAADVLRKYEEDGMADLLMNDRDAFMERYERGETIWNRAEEKWGKAE